MLAVRGPGARSALHAHHALHIILPVGGRLRVRASPRGSWQACAGLVTAPDVMHAVDASGLETLLAFFDPESAVGVALRASFDGAYRIVDGREREVLLGSAPAPAALMGPDGEAWSSLVVATLSGHRSPMLPRRIHPRVRRLLALLRDRTAAHDDPGDDRLEALAALVHLSPGRLMHAFSESIGIPLRPYLAWLRLQRACAGVVTGQPLARVAATAGFSDAAHMSRTFRRMLGTPPSALRPITR
jgi:AraC-like DNA-binding protein